jgi:hypothetical protein
MPNKTFTQFRVDNVTETLPVSLAYGQEVYYKDSTGALTLYVGDADGVAQPVVGSGYPSRVVNVFGTANDVAPNFTTPAGALTYALSLTPTLAEPVVIRMFAKADGTPYDMTGLDPWEDYANAGILFVSNFIRLNVTTVLPTTLPVGAQIWYIDGNGVETLWVGRADGSAWPAVSENEYSVAVTSVFADVGGLTFFNELTYSKLGNRVFIEATLDYSVQEMSTGLFLIINTIPMNARPVSGKSGFGYVSFGNYESPPNAIRPCFVDGGDLVVAVDDTTASLYGVMRISATYLTA